MLSSSVTKGQFFVGCCGCVQPMQVSQRQWLQMRRMMYNGKSRGKAYLLFALLSLVAPVVLGWGARQDRIAEPAVAVLGLSTSVIEADVNPDDALAAAKAWAVTVGKGLALRKTMDARIYRDMPSLIADANGRQLDLIAISTQEYLEGESVLRAEPSLTYVQTGQIEIEYVVIVRQDSGIKSLGDLRAKRIAAPRGGRSSLTLLWLDALLADNGLPSKESFFTEIRGVQKASQAILPVFFKQLDGAIVIRTAFETAVSLNPQLGQQMRKLAISPRIVPLVLCFRSDLPQEDKTAYIQTGLKLHETPGGLQAFNIYRIDRIVRWEPWYADGVRDLIKKQKQAKSIPEGKGR
jgi:ABC-type phosphate/phosphonate transport system substrate-binding protein